MDDLDIWLESSTDRGYKRSQPLQAEFEAAAAHLLKVDGWADPSQGNERRLLADLALEGGGVKGIGLVGAVLVLDEAGYAIRAIAGTSAGAIAATLIAAIVQGNNEKRPMTALRGYLSSLDFSRFMPEGPIHHFLDHRGGKVGNLVADASILSHRMGLYPGDYLREWLEPILRDLGVSTFGDLRLKPSDHPESLPPGHDYRLLVHTSDITRAELVRLPWDFNVYGCTPDEQDVVAAVRASMSIPFFFEPVTFTARPADVEIPAPDGGSIRQHYDGGTVTWVDGGMLRNFPIDAFDRTDGEPRWPTIGIKLSSLQKDFAPTEACESSIAVGVRCLKTMMDEWDTYQVDESSAGRTIFVDNDGLSATDFHLTLEQQDTLFLNGVKSATTFIIEMARAGGVPRRADESRTLVRARRSASRA
jgi:NTE family protein